MLRNDLEWAIGEGQTWLEARPRIAERLASLQGTKVTKERPTENCAGRAHFLDAKPITTDYPTAPADLELDVVTCHHGDYYAGKLPILQFFSSGKPSVDWNESFDEAKARRNPRYKGEGRFASPVLLRPRRLRDAQGPDRWQALVIFADKRQWPDGKQVHLSAGPHRNVIAPVSRALYDEMKRIRPTNVTFPQPAAGPAAIVLPR